jgi:hypothetical protein
MIKLVSPQILLGKHNIYAHLQSVEKNTPAFESKDVIKAIVLYASSRPQISDSQTEMLNKIMTACKFESSEVQYINLQLNPASVGEIISNYSPDIILVFGKTSLGRNMTELPENRAVSISGVQVLRTAELDKVETDAAVKKKLWITLQNILNIK